MNDSIKIINQMNALSDIIDTAQHNLAQGKVTNLSHLERDIDQLCQQTLSLPAREAATVQPVMGSMIARLEALALALKDFQNTLAPQQQKPEQ